MAPKHFYYISGFDQVFHSLEDAKWNLTVGFTRLEAIKHLQNQSICHFVGDKLHSETPIKVDETGRISFGKTRLV